MNLLDGKEKMLSPLSRCSPKSHALDGAFWKWLYLGCVNVDLGCDIGIKSVENEYHP